MRVNLLDRIGFRSRRFVVSFEVYVTEADSELSRGKSVQACRKQIGFVPSFIPIFFLKNLLLLTVIACTMSSGKDIPRADQRSTAPKFRPFRAVQEYRCHPRPTTGKSFLSTYHSIFTRISYPAFYPTKQFICRL